MPAPVTGKREPIVLFPGKGAAAIGEARTVRPDEGQRHAAGAQFLGGGAVERQAKNRRRGDIQSNLLLCLGDGKQCGRRSSLMVVNAGGDVKNLQESACVSARMSFVAAAVY